MLGISRCIRLFSVDDGVEPGGHCQLDTLRSTFTCEHTPLYSGLVRLLSVLRVWQRYLLCVHVLVSTTRKYTRTRQSDAKKTRTLKLNGRIETARRHSLARALSHNFSPHRRVFIQLCFSSSWHPFFFFLHSQFFQSFFFNLSSKFHFHGKTR